MSLCAYQKMPLIKQIGDSIIVQCSRGPTCLVRMLGTPGLKQGETFSRQITPKSGSCRRANGFVFYSPVVHTDVSIPSESEKIEKKVEKLPIRSFLISLSSHKSIGSFSFREFSSRCSQLSAAPASPIHHTRH